MKTRFEQPGTFPTTGPIGRTVRLLAGLGIAYMIFPDLVRYYEPITRVREGWDVPAGILLALLIAVHLLPHMIDRGFTVKWGWRSQAVWGGMALTAIAWNFAQHGSLWGPPVGWLVILTIAYSLGHLAISFVVSAVAATPG